MSKIFTNIEKYHLIRTTNKYELPNIMQEEKKKIITTKERKSTNDK